MKPATSTCVMVLAAVIVVLVGGGAVKGDWIVAQGWDLFNTQPGTNFMGVGFEGVPLGTFDFGPPIGPQATGDTDTIVERLGDAIVGGPGQTDTIDIEIVALQLVSVAPVDFGAGLGFHYVTLQPATPSTGTMDITFDDQAGGTFSSDFEVFVDIRIGALNGPILLSTSLVMTSSGNTWERTSPPCSVEIEDVNLHLKGDGTTDQDFWPVGPIQHDASGAAKHIVQPPEPTTVLLLLAGAWTLKRRRRK